MEFWGALSKEVLSCILPAIGWLSCPTHFASAHGGHHEGLGHVSGPQLFWTVVISMWGVRRELTFHSLMFSSHERNWYLKNKQTKKHVREFQLIFWKMKTFTLGPLKMKALMFLVLWISHINTCTPSPSPHRLPPQVWRPVLRAVWSRRLMWALFLGHQ